MGDYLERGILCFDMKFHKKDKSIYNVLIQCTILFFNI